MKKVLLAFYMLSFGLQISAQTFFTREGNVSFFSETPMENIEAHNSKATAVLDTEKGRLEFAVLIQAFQFEKALMQEHFNENYMESNKYPKAVFKGSVDGFEQGKWNADGTYAVQITGEMTIHGVTKTLTVPGTIIRENGVFRAKSSFPIVVSDFGIVVPSVVRDNIAKEVRVDVDVQLAPLNR
jgi:polyisoprenoid-binding protein YceI